MKKIFLYSSLALMAIGLASCNDFLDENRYPLDEESATEDFWNNSSNVETMCNTFYNQFDGYGNSANYGTDSGLFYFKTLSDDQGDRSFENWTFIQVPSTSSYWSNPFTEIRRAAYIINNVRTSTLNEDEKEYYEGVARVMRAFMYFQLVKKYGDVQWINEVISPDDDDMVFGARDDRDMVMDSVLADLNYACATLGSGTQITWSSDMANAMKSDICLWEGTFCKYRTSSDNGKAADESRAQKFLNECVTASENVMNAGYSIVSDYRSAYNSESLDGNNEIIFYKKYQDAVLRHSLISYTLSSTPISGLSKDAFEAFLFKDGKLANETSYDNTDEAQISMEIDPETGKPILNQEYSIRHMLEVRDARLSEITDPVIYFLGHTWVRDGGNNMTSVTGYGVRKYDNPDLPLLTRINTVRSYTDAPVFWLPVVLCNYAEAKAELGTITQDDLDKSINLLYKRADLPDLTTGTNLSDPKNIYGVAPLTWEIRRCRRCELIMDNDFRYWDLVRWHMLDKLDSQNNPDILLGANVTQYAQYVEDYNAAISAAGGTEDDMLKYEITTTVVDGKTYMDATTGLVRTYDPKYYYYPVPSTEISLNPALTQNPGW